jgi:aldehyde dehydrogenase (NAD+)
MVQFSATINHIESDIKNIHKYTAKRSIDTTIMAAPGKSYIIPEPYGVVLVIGAWNYPIFTCIP